MTEKPTEGTAVGRLGPEAIVPTGSAEAREERAEYRRGSRRGREDSALSAAAASLPEPRWAAGQAEARHAHHAPIKLWVR